MNDRNDRPGEDDDWIEHVLRADAAAAPHVDDEGFTARVLARLPLRAGWSPARWIVPAMGFLGCAIGLVALSGGIDLSASLTDIVNLESLSMRTFVKAALPVALLYWLAVGAAMQQG